MLNFAIVKSNFRFHKLKIAAKSNVKIAFHYHNIGLSAKRIFQRRKDWFKMHLTANDIWIIKMCVYIFRENQRGFGAKWKFCWRWWGVMISLESMDLYQKFDEN